MVGKTTEELMQLLRDKHGIDIEGEHHQLELLTMGYFHGFKGYRFIKTSDNRIPYKSFDEVIAVYQFDTNIKTLFYPYIMQIETALKNITLDTIIRIGSADFNYVYENLLNDFEKHEPGSSSYKKKMKNRLAVRNKVYSAISTQYQNDQAIIQHFVHQNKPVPLWAIFEILNLGDFGFFIHCLNEAVRKEISNNLSIDHKAHDRKGRVLEDIIFIIRDFRNAVAHNGVVFDVRYQNHQPTNRLISLLEAETSINNIDLDKITDYLILHVYILKKLGSHKRDLRKLIRTFFVLSERLKRKVPESIYEEILGDEHIDKIGQLRNII